jgi:hypothetical protein
MIFYEWHQMPGCKVNTWVATHGLSAGKKYFSRKGNIRILAFKRTSGEGIMKIPRMGRRGELFMFYEYIGVPKMKKNQ